MNRRPDSQTGIGLISRRALVIGGLQTGVMGALALRMREMQLVETEDYRLLADENRINIRLLPPARGGIFDRNGRVLATNDQNYRIVMVREDAGDVDDVLARLAQILPLPPEQIDQARAEMMRRSAFVPVTIAEQLSWNDLSRVAVNAPALPGVVPEVGLSRLYPQGAIAAHVVGYVGPVSDYDLTRGYLAQDGDPLLKIPRFQVGKTGIEAQREHTLRGSAGSKEIEVNAIGRVMRELSREEGKSGADLQLTLDTDLQAYTLARLGDESASAVVMDVTNGDLVAIGSAPTFDPNLFVRGISSADYADLIERETPRELQRRPLAAKAVQDGYPPGSTFKMVTSLAALEAGLVDPEETVRCVGHLEVADVKFHCWKRAGHGNMNLTTSLRESCDVYYYDISQRVGIDRIAEMARKLGLGIKHDVPLSAVARGIAPDKAWKMETRGEDWRIGDTVNASIGQGYVLATPLQLAVMTARLATGRAVSPRLIDRINGVEQPSGAGPDLGVNPNNLQRIRAGMDAVVNHNRGTAYRSRLVGDGMRMAGKTGTSQVRRITAEERARGVTRNEDLPWNRRDHAIFVCYAPADNPRYAVSVVVQHGGGGSSTAAPIARDIMARALRGGPVPLSAYPSAARSSVRASEARVADAMARLKGSDPR